MAAADMYDAAEEILNLCEFLLEGDGAPIDRAFVSKGDPADYCDALSVRTTIGERLLDSTQTGFQHRSGRQNEVTFTIRVVRCLPQNDGDAVPVAVLNDYAERAYRDAWVIWNGLMAAKRQNLILDGYCSAFDMDFATPTPNLTFGGWEIVLRAVLYGYTPDLST